MLRVSMNNSGGRLDSRAVETDEEAAEAAIALIRDAGRLFEGDSITVVEED